MAEDTPTPPQNGGAPENAPQFAALAQYVKDLSVENPNAPKSFQFQGQPRIDLDFKIDINKVNEEVHEVVLKAEAKAQADEGVQFVIDLAYAGLFGMRNVTEQQMQPFLLIEAPRLLFPFARQIIAEATQQAGFPPLMLEPIDFGSAYMAQQQALRQQAEQAATAGEQPAEDGEAAAPATEDETKDA